MTTWTARTSRRRLINGTLVGGATAFSLAVLGCGGSSKKDEQQGAAQPGASASSSGAAQPAGDPRRGGTLQRRIANEFVSADSIIQSTSSAQEFAGHVYSRLAQFIAYPDAEKSANREITADLALTWEQPDKTTYLFHLNPAAVYHDKPPVNGRKVTAQDVVATFRKFTTETKNANRNYLAIVDGDPVAVDDSTVQLKTKTPYSPLLALVADGTFWVYPRELAEDDNLRLNSPAGSGPWTLEQKQVGVVWAFKAFPNYHRKDAAGRKIPYLDELRVNTIPEDAQNVSQLLAGKLDYSDVTFDQLAQVKRQLGGATIKTGVPTAMNYTSCQMRSGPFQDVRLRRAMSMAQDRNAFLQAFSGGEGYWHNMMPAGMGEFYLDPRKGEIGAAGQWYKHNPAEVQKLLAAAGFSTTEFNFIYPTGISDTITQRGVLAYDMVVKAGFKGAKVVPQDLKSEFSAPGKTFFGHAYDGVFFGNEGGFPDPQITLFNMLHSQSARNHPGVKDAQLDKMIDQLGAEFDRPARVKLSHDIQRYASDQMYYVPNSFGASNTVLQKWVQNYLVSVSFGYASESLAYTWLNEKR